MKQSSLSQKEQEVLKQYFLKEIQKTIKTLHNQPHGLFRR